jgi:hypothetical protein
MSLNPQFKSFLNFTGIFLGREFLGVQTRHCTLQLRGTMLKEKLMPWWMPGVLALSSAFSDPFLRSPHQMTFPYCLDGPLAGDCHFQ